LFVSLWAGSGAGNPQILRLPAERLPR
jgi:hypothetical protein